MNPATPPASPARRHVGRWIALGLVLLLSPFVVLGVGAISMLTLDSDAAVLRREVMAATDANWHTKVQLDIGGITLGAVRTGLRFVHHEHMDEARLALHAVRSASVGVYERDSNEAGWSRAQLFTRTDEMMKQRGWTRLVGVADGRETVLIYTSDVSGTDSRIGLCLAVVDGQELVVVSTKVDAGVLAELAAKHMPKDGLREKLRTVKLNF